MNIFIFIDLTNKELPSVFCYFETMTTNIYSILLVQLKKVKLGGKKKKQKAERKRNFIKSMEEKWG